MNRAVSGSLDETGSRTRECGRRARHTLLSDSFGGTPATVCSPTLGTPATVICPLGAAMVRPLIEISPPTSDTDLPSSTAMEGPAFTVMGPEVRSPKNPNATTGALDNVLCFAKLAKNCAPSPIRT